MNPQPFGYYTLINRINVGGMAEVFKACYYQEDGKPAFAAIKRILPHLAQDHSFVEMFLSEATTSSRLQHPGIAQIIEQGEEEGEYFISMEYISGRDLLYLRHHLRERGMLLSPALSAYVISCVADALDYAHALSDEQGRHLEIIHRDVSPQNILISYDGAVKLIDFGIAKAKDRGYEATKAGVLKGKFGYMAPEQIRGKPTDHRLDIFSLGVVLYELLTNQRLFLGENDLETLEMVREARVSAPSLVNKWVSPELDRITLQALHVDPDERYQRAGELARELRLFIQQNAPSTNQSTLRSWMYQEFSNYIAHEQAQESHILDQLKYDEVEESISEYTTETHTGDLNQLLAQPSKQTHDDTQPPGSIGNENSFSFKTEAYQAIAIAPYQNDEVPTRPVSAEVFKDLQSKGYQLPAKDYVYAVEADLNLDTNEVPKRTHALETYEVEELLDGSLEEISMSEDGQIHEEITPADQLLDSLTTQDVKEQVNPLKTAHGIPAILDHLEATAPITQEERDAIFAFGQQHLAQQAQNGNPPFSTTMPILSNLNSLQRPFSPQTQHESPFQQPSPHNVGVDLAATKPVSLPSEAHLVIPHSLAPAESMNVDVQHVEEDVLNRLRNEERERAAEITGPALEALGFGHDLQTSPQRSYLKLVVGIVALATVATVAVMFIPKLLFAPLSVTVRVSPRDQLTITQQPEEGEQTQKGPLKSPFQLSLTVPTIVRIEREGFEPYESRLDPSSRELSTGELNVELQRLYQKVDLNVSSIPPGAKIWVNDQLLSKKTPLRGYSVYPSHLGEVKVRVQARGEPQEQSKTVPKGQKSPPLGFIFEL